VARFALLRLVHVPFGAEGRLDNRVADLQIRVAMSWSSDDNVAYPALADLQTDLPSLARR
jgi:hypothetical protein